MSGSPLMAHGEHGQPHGPYPGRDRTAADGKGLPELEIKGSKSLCPCRLRRSTMLSGNSSFVCPLLQAGCKSQGNTPQYSHGDTGFKMHQDSLSRGLPKPGPSLHLWSPGYHAFPSLTLVFFLPTQANFSRLPWSGGFLYCSELTYPHTSERLHTYDIPQTHTVFGDLLQHLKPKSLANIFYL